MELVEGLVQSTLAGDVASLQVCLQQSVVSGLPVDFQTEGGVTLLMHAITAAGTDPHPYGQYADTCMMLIQAGVPLDAVDGAYGRSAAHWAAHYNQYELLDIIMLAGFNYMMVDLQGLSAFHLAVMSGSIESVQVMLQRVAPEVIEMRTIEGLTPLMVAAQAGNTQIAQLLLQVGCDIHAVDEVLARTAVHIAAESGNSDVVDLLLKNEASLDTPDARGLTPIHIAASLDTKDVLSIICNLLGNRVLDVPDVEGLTPLLYACRAGSEANVKFMIKKKANILVRDGQEGKTCIHLAAESESATAVKVVQLLIQKSKTLMEEKDSFGRTPLLTAAGVGNVDVAKQLLLSGCNAKAVDNESYTALHWATIRGRSEVVALLLQHGFSGLEQDNNGATPLHHAVRSSAVPSEESADPALVEISQGALECIKVLLDKGVSQTSIDNNRMQPIHWALQCSNNIEAIHLLISSGADPNQQDDAGMRGLHVAAKHGVTDGCQYLIEVAGVHGNVLDEYEQTALFYSIESQALSCSEYLLGIGCSANHRNKDERSPVHIAASVGSLEAVELLLSHGGDASLKSIHNTTPLHDAASQGHTDVLQYFLASAYDPNANCENGVVTPLHFAVSGENMDCVQLLLDAGAKVNAVMVAEEGVVLSPLDYAEDNEEIKQLLLSYGALPGSELKPPTPPPVVEATPEHEEAATEPVTVEESDAGVPTAEESNRHSEKTKIERPSSRPLVRRDRKLDLFADDEQQVRPASGEQFPPKRANLVSRALTVLKKRSPPQESILSSVIGFYGAQATMLAAAVIATSLGDKTMEIAEKVATDSAEELKKASAEFEGSLPDLEWLQTPIREPTPTPEPPTPPKSPTPPPPSPPPVEIKMDEYERRLRKAKAQMDQTKSLGYQAMEELLKAQRTHTQLKRQFAKAKLEEELSKKRELFQKIEEQAKAESQKLMERYRDRMKKADNSALVVTSDINDQLESAHNQNTELASIMGKMGLSSRPTVSEWLQRKQEEKRTQLKDTLVGWTRTKQQRDTAISLQQAVTTRRVMRHAAWSMKKTLTAQLQALEKQESTLQASLESKGVHVLVKHTCSPRRTVPIRSTPAYPTQPQPQPQYHTAASTMTITARQPPHRRASRPPARVVSTGCIRATPAGFLKMRDVSPPPRPQVHRQTSSLPDSTLWEMGESYIDGRISFSPRLTHRAYGPKTVHAERSLHFLPPEDYEQLRNSRRRQFKANATQPSEQVAAKSSQHVDQTLKQIFSQTTPTAEYHTLASSLGLHHGRSPPGKKGSASPSILPMKVIDQPQQVSSHLVST